EDIDKDELKETQIALWLINSSITSPKLEDIFSFAKTKDFVKARQAVFSELEKRNLKKVFEEIERPLIAVVRKMNKRGVKIDTEYLNKLSKEYHKELTKLEENIWKEAAPHTKESDMEKFNVASPKQLAVVLFDRMGLTAKGLKKTEGGARSTKESELLKLKDAHPIIELILEYREFAKLLSTYIDNMPQMADAGGRLHAEFLQAGAATGRMASQNPGLQNIPIKTEAGKRIRNAFIAEDGFKILSIDYSQIELRVAAILSSDPKLLEIFRNGEDVHTAVASEVFGVEREKVDYEMRRKAKVINFGIIYGMGINALKTNLGASREEATKFHNDYFEKFSTLARYLDEVKAFAYKEGYTETLFGRRRYFEGLKSVLPFIRAASERQAINAPLQGTAADVIKLAMLRVDEFLQKENLEDKVYLTMQVHDELVYEVKEDLVEKVAPKIREVMEGVLSPKESKEVPMMAESYVGKNWGAMQRIADSSQT
ncbi:MAG: DNA polymerase, partial [bacterium]|nr:DNA polymerase [bacterium]